MAEGSFNKILNHKKIKKDFARKKQKEAKTSGKRRGVSQERVIRVKEYPGTVAKFSIVKA